RVSRHRAGAVSRPAPGRHPNRFGDPRRSCAATHSAAAGRERDSTWHRQEQVQSRAVHQRTALWIIIGIACVRQWPRPRCRCDRWRWSRQYSRTIAPSLWRQRDFLTDARERRRRCRYHRVTMAHVVTVAIVDDEPLAREGLRTLLQSDRDVEVVAECPDGQAAIEAIRRTKPDIVFLDVQMPDL